jgi:hypothetical protein
VLFGDLDGRLHLWRLGKHFIIQGAHEAAIANATAAAAAAASANSSSTTSAATVKHTATAATAGGTDVKSSHDVQIHSDTVMKVCMHAVVLFDIVLFGQLLAAPSLELCRCKLYCYFSMRANVTVRCTGHSSWHL